MDLSEVVVCPTVMGGKTDVASPNAGVLKVAHAFGQDGAVRTLENLHVKANGRDLQRSQTSVTVVEVACDLGVLGVAAVGFRAVEIRRAGCHEGIHRGIISCRVRRGIADRRIRSRIAACGLRRRITASSIHDGIIDAANLGYQTAGQCAGDKVSRLGCAAAPDGGVSTFETFGGICFGDFGWG